ncbi:hypothetical protein OG563_05935 [Nocardia vinacea]|uniref:Uncharacterized protein n=1 Tax=Nocardia vinacea TaxID=96468 RepID=A0ABZ1YX11_9NOCA|nr:hypothetical protein [Nocardia vinacea]
MYEDALLNPPNICGSAEVELAHEQMRRHRACRIQRCAWKRVAYYTLVRHGRIAPPKSSPRERARLRGIDFPVDTTDHPLPEGIPELRTLHQVLDGLAQLALPPTSSGSGGEG